jgi:hypothetical protein
LFEGYHNRRKKLSKENPSQSGCDHQGANASIGKGHDMPPHDSAPAVKNGGFPQY